MFLIGYGGNAQILKKKLPDKLVVLSFDDATASQYSIVAPLLKQYGFGGTFFVCEFPPNFSDSSKYMNWRQMKELNDMGFEIANHTQNHPNLTSLKPDQIKAQLEYIENKCKLMKITKPVDFAYPGYSFNLSVVDVLREKGYQFARLGGSRAYDPLSDYPLLVPSWGMNADNKEQIMDAFKEARNGKIVVLTIHGVPDAEHPWVNTPPQLFKEYLQYLSDQHFRVISFRDLNKYINVKKAIKTIAPDVNKKLMN
jgi:peptidoglycan/xylan/chitin deacetylase (PgdA/CDA1 family)